jgi:hypothetical protein
VDLEVRASVSFRTVEPLPGITTRERSNEERERREHAEQNMNHTQQGQERLRHVNINHPTVSLY